MHHDGLSGRERAVLFALLAEARQVSNAELHALIGIRLEGKVRRKLNELKLVESEKHGRAFVHELSDAGWRWCADELSAGPAGRGGQKASAITDGSFLALVTDQYLRTIVIVGRPELGAPDWCANVPGKPMSDQEITDVVAWLASKRVANPGQPYPASHNAQPQESDGAKRK